MLNLLRKRILLEYLFYRKERESYKSKIKLLSKIDKNYDDTFDMNKLSEIREFIKKSGFLIKKDMDSEYVMGERFGLQLQELNDFINNKLFDSHRMVLEKTMKQIQSKKIRMR